MSLLFYTDTLLPLKADVLPSLGKIRGSEQSTCMCVQVQGKREDSACARVHACVHTHTNTHTLTLKKPAIAASHLQKPFMRPRRPKISLVCTYCSLR